MFQPWSPRAASRVQLMNGSLAAPFLPAAALLLINGPRYQRC
jgi:hypothetical protein